MKRLKYFLLPLLSIGVLTPIVSTSCSNSNEYSIKDIIELYKNKPITITEIECEDTAASLNTEVCKKLSLNTEYKISNEIRYWCFHFLNTVDYSINEIKLCNSNKTIIDLIKEGKVKTSVSLKDSYEYKNVDAKRYYSVSITSAIELLYTSDCADVKAGDNFTYIFEVKEDQLFKSSPSTYDQNKWKLYFPSYQKDEIFGIVQSNKFSQIVGIKNDYSADDSYYNFVRKS